MKPWLLEIILSLIVLVIGGFLVAGIYTVAADPQERVVLTHPLGCPPDRPF